MTLNRQQNKFFRYLLENYFYLYLEDNIIFSDRYFLTSERSNFKKISKELDSFLSQKCVYKVNGLYYKFSYESIEKIASFFCYIKISGELL